MRSPGRATVVALLGLWSIVNLGISTALAGQKAVLPEVVPVLDCRPSARDGEGSASVEPAGPVPAASIQSFAIRFTTGESGIAPDGFVILQVSPWWGWSEPQITAPGQAGFVAVESSVPDSELSIHVLPLHRLLVTAPDRGLRPGESLTFRYGPARVDRYAEAEELFQIFVDGDGDGHYAGIAEPPTMRLLAGPPVELAVWGPSRAVPGERVTLHAAALDATGSWAELPSGEYRLRLHDQDRILDQTTRPQTTPQGTLELQTTVPAEGAFLWSVEGPSGLAGRSNVLLAQGGRPSLQLFFGDLHGHTRLSDGTGTPEDYYRYARHVSGLQIAAVTDHADYGTLRLERAPWERIRRAAREAYEPGWFVTLLGYEWTNWTYGHRNVYFPADHGALYRSIDPESDTPQELWKLLEPHQAMTVAHHVGGGPIHTDWSIPPHPMERLVEICSIHGSSESYGGQASIYHPVRGAFVQDALDRGYRLGLIGSGDTHDGHPGRRSVGARVGGLVGVLAPRLDRTEVWAALQRRQVYATSGPKIILFFRVGDAPMGSEITWPARRDGLPIAVLAAGCDPIDRVEILRDGQVVHQQEGQGLLARLLLEDPHPPRDRASYYYARVVQEDGNMAWSSPVWVSPE